MVAMIATPKTMYDNSWYPDFGMTNHIIRATSSSYGQC